MMLQQVGWVGLGWVGLGSRFQEGLFAYVSATPPAAPWTAAPSPRGVASSLQLLDDGPWIVDHGPRTVCLMHNSAEF